MPRGVYVASYPITSVTTAATMLYITSPANLGVEVLEVSIGNVNQDTAEQLHWEFTRITSLGTPTVTATVTPEKTEQGDQVAGSTVKVKVTASEPTYHTVPYDQRGLSNKAQYMFRPLTESVLLMNTASAGLRLVGTIDSSTNFNVQIKFREFG